MSTYNILQYADTILYRENFTNGLTQAPSSRAVRVAATCGSVGGCQTGLDICIYNIYIYIYIYIYIERQRDISICVNKYINVIL